MSDDFNLGEALGAVFGAPTEIADGITAFGLKPMTQTMLPEQVDDLLQEMRKADYNTVGRDFFESRFARLSAAGWEIGILAFSQVLTHGRRGRLLRTPKNEWRNLAYMFNAQTMVKVWYWNNPALSKAYAVDLAARNPAPAGNYVTFDRTQLNKWNTTK